MTVPRETLPADILAWATEMRVAFPNCKLRFACNEVTGAQFGNPAWDDPGAPEKLRADQAAVNAKQWAEGT